MKKILFAISMMFAMVACINEDLPQTTTPQEGDMVRLTFGVQVPEAGAATRVMGNEAINTLHVIVFDEQGYYKFKTAATLSAGNFPNDPTLRQFTVELPNSSAKRSIHFVANIDPAQFDAINSGHEDGVMSNLYVTGDADAYWQRMEFTGISDKADAGETMFKSGVIVPLVRNYAKITVTDKTGSNDNFVLTGYKVFNTRKQGSVAAYDGAFAEFTEMDPVADANGRLFTPKEYSELSYECNESGDLNTEGIGNYTSIAPTYVRETAENSAPYIIICGTYNGETCYYKLDFIVGGDKVNIYRNFAYNFSINSVTKPGLTEEQAKNQKTGENGMSFDSGTESLLNISDGTGHLFVNATTVVLVNPNTYYLMYKYIPDINNPAENVNVGVSHDAGAGDVINRVVSEGNVSDLINNLPEGYTKADFEDYQDYRYIEIQPNVLPNIPEKQEVTITNGRNLTRTVTLYLQQPYKMTVNAYDGGSTTDDGEVPRGLNEDVWVDVAIPSDIQEALFPLEFVFEASELSLYPNAGENNMPVRTGLSVTGSGATTFGFVYTLDKNAYDNLPTDAQGNKVFTAKFLTNKAVSASDVWVSNKYFNSASGSFKNPDPVRITSLTFSAKGTTLNESNRTVTIACGNWSTTFTLRSNSNSDSHTYDLSNYNLTDDMSVTISGNYTYWRTTYSTNYTTTLGDLQNANITLNFEQE